MKKLIIIVFLSFFYFSCSFNNPFLSSFLVNNTEEQIYKGNDYVFIIDKSGSMADFGRITQIRNIIISLISHLNTLDLDNRYAFVVYSDYPILIQNWTNDINIITNSLNNFSCNGNFESSLESLRIVLNSAVNNTLVNSDPLSFRKNVKKKIFLFVEEDSDIPYYEENRFPGQVPSEIILPPLPPILIYDPPIPFPTDPNNGYCLEITETANILANNNVILYLFIKKDLTNPNAALNQFSDPELQSQNYDFTDFNKKETLNNLVNNGLGECLQAKLLRMGKSVRSIDLNIFDVSSDNYDNLFNNVLVKSTYD